MNAVLKPLRNFGEQLFKASVTISSYWSSAVLFITLRCSDLPLKILKICHLTYFGAVRTLKKGGQKQTKNERNARGNFALGRALSRKLKLKNPPL